MGMAQTWARMRGPQKAPPGIKELWLLLSVDLQLFLFFFIMFVVEWIAAPAEFQLGYDAVNGPIAFSNTIVLLTSSYFVVRMTDAFKQGDESAVRKALVTVIMLGCAFVILKVVGYFADYNAGHFEFDNAFFGYYVMITATHLFHVLVGVVLFVVCLVKVREWLDASRIDLVESCAVFWHFVDMIWVLLFPLCYLMG